MWAIRVICQREKMRPFTFPKKQLHISFSTPMWGWNYRMTKREKNRRNGTEHNSGMHADLLQMVGCPWCKRPYARHHTVCPSVKERPCLQNSGNTYYTRVCVYPCYRTTAWAWPLFSPHALSAAVIAHTSWYRAAEGTVWTKRSNTVLSF